MRRRPTFTHFLILLFIIVCSWFAYTNYNLNKILGQNQHSQKQLLQINKQITEFLGEPELGDNDYNLLPKLAKKLESHKKEDRLMQKKKEKYEDVILEQKSINGNLKKQLQDEREALLKVDYKELVRNAGERFRNSSINNNNVDLSVIVAYDWADSKITTRPLSLLYIMDYFQQFATKNNKKVEVVMVHPLQYSHEEEGMILSNNVITEYKSITSNHLDTLFNEAASEAVGQYLLFIPIVPSKNGYLDLELFLDIPKMIGSFNSPGVGMVGGISFNNENDTLINAGIDFAYAVKDAVTPFARYVGAGLKYPKMKETPPCVSRTGMMMERKTFKEVGGFTRSYSKDNTASVSHLMEDADLCLRVREKDLKVISSLFILLENRIKTAHFPGSVTKSQRETLVFQFNNTWAPQVRKIVESKKELLDFSLVWDLYCGCTGVNVEAINYLVALESKLDVGAVAGDGCWCGGFPTYVQESLIRISSRAIGPKVDVWVSHKPPDKYPSFPYNGLVKIAERPTRIIGRSMSETDSIKADWVEKSQQADEIWIPTEFHRDVFSVSGVSKDKLQVIEESLDTTLYDPETTIPLPLNPVYGDSFKFLSVFKWETRKGWDVLLQAYFEEFKGSENVVLILQTYLYGERNPRDRRKAEDKIRTYANSLKLNHTLPPVLVLTDELPELQMPQLYKACDAFVLPTRGEGWGLPVMEAMAMAMPSIVTNWSGPTQFTTHDTAYLLPFDSLEKVPKNFEGGSGNEKWAKPSLVELKKIMRSIYKNPAEAKKVGAKARAHIKEFFDRDIIADKMVSRLKEIQKITQ